MTAKYRIEGRFRPAAWRPLVEVGPAFRQGSYLPHFGVAAGADLERRVGALKIAPGVRVHALARVSWNGAKRNRDAPGSTVLECLLVGYSENGPRSGLVRSAPRDTHTIPVDSGISPFFQQTSGSDEGGALRRIGNDTRSPSHKG